MITSNPSALGMDVFIVYLPHHKGNALTIGITTGPQDTGCQMVGAAFLFDKGCYRLRSIHLHAPTMLTAHAHIHLCMMTQRLVLGVTQAGLPTHQLHDTGHVTQPP